MLESLVPGLNAAIHGQKLPEHVRSIVPDGITQVKLIDAAPIGINVRSTVATYANVHDELRKKFAATPDARQAGYKAGDFSYNTGKLRCPVCDGTGSISLDVQFLPDVEIPCPECRGSRYAKEAGQIFYTSKSGTRYSLPQLMDMDVNTALTACADWPVVRQRLTVLQELGLGYLTLGEETPGLSGGEAQRLKLASEIGRIQTDSVFVFDEPSIGLHQSDNRKLIDSLKRLRDAQNSIIVVEHDKDMMLEADYVVDIGPKAGRKGGEVVFRVRPTRCCAPKRLRRAISAVRCVSRCPPCAARVTDIRSSCSDARATTCRTWISACRSALLRASAACRAAASRRSSTVRSSPSSRGSSTVRSRSRCRMRRFAAWRISTKS